ncbi:hypothetical protein GLYMA_08G138400v4 [Glycine max]|nr:hypothetical protein GLYMA_08G138400v4 [Glycine max]KAH1051126.1 hypothetical protein GYH30_021181 [Glycine max]
MYTTQLLLFSYSVTAVVVRTQKQPFSAATSHYIPSQWLAHSVQICGGGFE